MHIETIDILITSIASVKTIILFLLHPENLLRNAKTENEINEIMSKYTFSSNQEDIKEMLIWIRSNGFDDNTMKNTRNVKYIKLLDKLSFEFIDFYLKFLTSVAAEASDPIRTCDVYSKVGEYILQIMRLRLVINPEVQIAMNVHTQTKIEYVAAKAFWLNDDGVKVRKFTRSLGRLDEYKGIKDPKLIEEANAKIQEVIYNTYKESYPE